MHAFDEYTITVSVPPQIIMPPSNVPRAQHAVLYCDESGNSGPNYLDAAQPFYVLGAWLVPDSGNEAAWLAVEKASKEISPQADELKSASVLRGERQKLRAVQLIKYLGQCGAIPLYLIAEKRFCVAGKIVETFLDPFYNPLLRNGITGDGETKKEIANQLYDRLPDDVLTRFAMAYRKPDAMGLGDALRAVASESRDHLSLEMAEALLGSEEQIKEIAEAETSNWLPGKLDATLNMPCLVSFLMMVEALGRVGLHRPIRFVHDQQHAYEAGYKKIFELHKGMPKLFAKMPGGEVPWGRLEAIAEFETADSKTRLPIQAADMLAGVINHLMRLAISGAEPSNADLELAKLTLPGLFFEEVKVAWPIWSDTAIERVVGSLIIKAIRPPAASEEEIEKARAVVDARDAPVLPVAGRELPDRPRFKIPSPIFALVGRTSGNLMVLEPPPEEVEASDGAAQPVVPFFSTATGAASFLESVNHQPEPHSVQSYDGPEMEQLVEKLEECTEHADCIVFDPGSEGMEHLYLPAFLESMRAIFGRMKRLFRTGLDQVVMQRSTMNGHEAISALLSDGRYGAMWAPIGEAVVGATREEVLRELARSQPKPGLELPPR